MKLTEYQVYGKGSDIEFSEVTFKSPSGNEITVTIEKDGKNYINCDSIEFDEVLEVIEMIKSGKVVIEV